MAPRLDLGVKFMTTIYLLLAKHGPNDAGEVVDVYATKSLANFTKGFLEAENADYVDAINSSDRAAIQPPFFTATLVVEEREVKA